jgi:hypothetical protein
MTMIAASAVQAGRFRTEPWRRSATPRARSWCGRPDLEVPGPAAPGASDVGSEVRKRPVSARPGTYLGRSMRAHIRRCVECPKCHTRYLIGFSPYCNGSYLVLTTARTSEEYTLYCACCKPAALSRWERSQMNAYAVARAAHDRGYGTCSEIIPVADKRGGRRPDGSEGLPDTHVLQRKLFE